MIVLGTEMPLSTPADLSLTKRTLLRAIVWYRKVIREDIISMPF